MSKAHAPSPLVSVVLPTYKRVGSIAKAIDSALSQTVTDIEVIVVDDCSHDGTAELVRSIDDPRVRLLVHETNRGGNAARATGIAAGRGEWVAFLDSDDEWLPDKLALQLAQLRERGPEYGFSTVWLDMLDSDGRLVDRRRPTVDGWIADELLCGNWLGGFSSVVVSRSALEAVGGVDQSLPACQDWDLFARVCRAVKACAVQEVLVRYLVDSGDPVRISRNGASVRAGLRHMYAMFDARRDALSRDQQQRATRYFAEMFANVAALGDVLEVLGAGLRSAGPVSPRFAAHMVVRSLGKRLRATPPAAPVRQAQPEAADEPEGGGAVRSPGAGTGSGPT